MRSRFNSGLLRILLFAFIFVLSACGILNGETPTPTPTPPQVTSLLVAMSGTDPIQVQATIAGDLKNSCNTLTGVNVQQQGMTFVLDVQYNFADTGSCAEAVIPFTEIVPLNVTGLAPGTYTVTAGGFNQTFTLQGPVTPPAASLTTSAAEVMAGQSLNVTGANFPANVQVEISIGLVNADRSALSTVQSGADGNFTTPVTIPANAVVGEQWVIGATVNNVTTLSNPVTVVAQPSPATETPPPDGSLSQTNVYMIALNDGGQNGPLVGCNDSVVPVAIDIQPTNAPMRATYNALFNIKDENYGGYHNSLYQSNLEVAGINIINRHAVVSLTGTLGVTGQCETPRLIAQLRYVALQFSTVDQVTIYVNGRLLYGTYYPYGRG